MCRLFPQISAKLHPDGNMEQTIGTKPALQLIDEVFLGAYNLGRGPVANKGDLLAALGQLFDCPCKRIQPTRKQDHVVGRKPRLVAVSKFEVGLDSWRMFQRREL